MNSCPGSKGMANELTGPTDTVGDAGAAGSVGFVNSLSRAPTIAGFCALRDPSKWSKDRFSSMSTTKCSILDNIAGPVVGGSLKVQSLRWVIGFSNIRAALFLVGR